MFSTLNSHTLRLSAPHSTPGARIKETSSFQIRMHRFLMFS
jgi:hypothetical protein